MDKSGMTGSDWAHYLASSANDKANKLEWQMKVLAKKLGIDDIAAEVTKLRDEEIKLEQEKKEAEVAAAEAEAEAQGISFTEYMANKIAESNMRAMAASSAHLIAMMKDKTDKEDT